MDETTRIALNALAERVAKIERREEEERMEMAPPIGIFPEEDEEAGGGGGGATQGKCGMFDWDQETRTMGAGGCMVGRTWKNAANTGQKEDGTYWLRVILGSNGDQVRVVEENEMTGNTDTTTYLPIYTIVNGEVTTDRRGAFVVPCWE